MDTIKHTPISISNSELDPQSEHFLLKTAKWAKFLSIVGFTFLGLFIVGILSTTIVIVVTDNYMENTSQNYEYVPGTISWIYICICIMIALIYFLPLYYLYRFSVRMKQAIPENNQVALIDSFRFLSKHYTFIGTLTLVMLIILAITFTNVFIGIFGAV